MKILKCSLAEFKEAFPSYEQVEENSNLIYYKIELDKKVFIGATKDPETHLFEFTDTDNVNKIKHSDPNFEYEILSLIADDYEPREFDTPIVPVNDIDWENREEELAKELKQLDNRIIAERIFNVFVLLLVIAIFYFSLRLRG